MQNPNKEKRVTSTPKDSNRTDEKVTLIAYGDAQFNSSMKGKLPSPTNSKGKIEIISVDEYLTSQTCNSCKERNLNYLSVAGSKRKFHAVLKCDT
ncbi:hypothetical protein MFLAVUS_006681 [Mucor flavus]|uniref:Uncharacterized protein n=1 Tax=Mucor flavus TaxID=439312 RepID=A0ABP9Z284_9FUNG